MSQVAVPIFDEINAKFHLFYQKVTTDYIYLIVLTIHIEFKNNLLSLFCSIEKSKKQQPSDMANHLRHTKETMHNGLKPF